MKSNNWCKHYIKQLERDIQFFELRAGFKRYQFESDTIKFENVDYDYFSIQTDNSFSGNKVPIDYAKYTLDDMHYEESDYEYAISRIKIAEYLSKYCKKTLDEHNI